MFYELIYIRWYKVWRLRKTKVLFSNIWFNVELFHSIPSKMKNETRFNKNIFSKIKKKYKSCVQSFAEWNIVKCHYLFPKKCCNKIYYIKKNSCKNILTEILLNCYKFFLSLANISTLISCPVTSINFLNIIQILCSMVKV